MDNTDDINKLPPETAGNPRPTRVLRHGYPSSYANPNIEYYTFRPFEDKSSVAVLKRICGLCQAAPKYWKMTFHFNPGIYGNLPWYARFTDNVNELSPAYWFGDPRHQKTPEIVFRRYNVNQRSGYIDKVYEKPERYEPFVPLTHTYAWQASRTEEFLLDYLGVEAQNNKEQYDPVTWFLYYGRMLPWSHTRFKQLPNTFHLGVDPSFINLKTDSPLLLLDGVEALTEADVIDNDFIGWHLALVRRDRPSDIGIDIGLSTNWLTLENYDVLMYWTLTHHKFNCLGVNKLRIAFIMPGITTFIPDPSVLDVTATLVPFYP